MDAIGTGLNAHSAEEDSMRIQFCTVYKVDCRTDDTTRRLGPLLCVIQ